MNTKQQLSQAASAIANSIVELVERTDGPVTLARIAREIPGFAEKEPPAWCYVVNHAQGEMFIWDGMTEAGNAALRDVMSGRRVAVQFVNPLPYILENSISASKNWQPIVLLPKSAGNLVTRNWLMRVSPDCQEHVVARAAKKRITGYRPIAPRAVNFVSDQFSV
jgi:hypothetical protein